MLLVPLLLCDNGHNCLRVTLIFNRRNRNDGIVISFGGRGFVVFVMLLQHLGDVVVVDFGLCDRGLQHGVV